MKDFVKRAQLARREIEEGNVIVLLKDIEDPFSPIPKGSVMTVSFVDDIGQIHGEWDNGSRLALVYGEDEFRVI